MKNILFSTTRQWNPGDEFILFGAIKILRQYLGDFNPIIFNRNPDIRDGFRVNCYPEKIRRKFQYIEGIKYFKGKTYLEKILKLEMMDNSFKDRTSYEIIDMVVFAGSPEWYSKRLLPLFYYIEKYQIPCIFLAIGLGEEVNLKSVEKVMGNILYNAKLITTRDKSTESFLKKYHACYLPCTALLSSSKTKHVKSVNKIALIYATNKATICNRVSKETHAFLLKLYREILKKYSNVTFVCHYIDELEEIKKDFPDQEVFYSYSAEDYCDIYSKYDLVIGSRVHGIGLAASLGIPGIMIVHDLRGKTARGFLAECVNYRQISVGECMNVIEDIINDIEIYSEKLITHKKETEKQYLSLFSKKGLEI